MSRIIEFVWLHHLFLGMTLIPPCIWLVVISCFFLTLALCVLVRCVGLEQYVLEKSSWGRWCFMALNLTWIRITGWLSYSHVPILLWLISNSQAKEILLGPGLWTVHRVHLAIFFPFAGSFICSCRGHGSEDGLAGSVSTVFILLYFHFAGSIMCSCRGCGSEDGSPNKFQRLLLSSNYVYASPFLSP